MECNINDLNFDNYFAALLTPIELPENDNIAKLPPIHTLNNSFGGSPHAGVSNLFSSITNHNYLGESVYVQSIKNEIPDNCSTDLSSSSQNLEENFFEETTWLKEDKIPESCIAEIEVQGITDSPASNYLSEEEAITSPVSIKLENVQVAKNDKKSIKQKTMKDKKSIKQAHKEKNSKDKKSPKRQRATEEEYTLEAAKKKRRTNYCFDIHRIYCPHSKKEKYYCNVTLQGNLQETVELIKGKRGKYAYTFYDQRKQRKERRYWPSQSCGPVLEDTCPCKHCNVDNNDIKKVSCSQEVKRENSTKGTPATDDNCVLILEDVFLDM